MKVAIVGLGYVGTVTTAVFASQGYHVNVHDIDTNKITAIKNPDTAFFEADVKDLLSRVTVQNNIFVSSSLFEAVNDAAIIMVCVGTPSTDVGNHDPSALFEVFEEIKLKAKKGFQEQKIILNRSTTPPNIHSKLDEICSQIPNVIYCCHPEYLREGSAVKDFTNPPKILFGIDQDPSQQIQNALKSLYKEFAQELVFKDLATAALDKYASNAFHALKITFANEIGYLAASVGANAKQVLDLLKSDKQLNISEAYLSPGMPFGGSCLPKDLSTIEEFSAVVDEKLPLIEALSISNQNQKGQISDFIVRQHKLLTDKKQSTKPILFYGISFKENTGDMRNSPNIEIVETVANKIDNYFVYDKDLSENDPEHNATSLINIPNSIRPNLLTMFPDLSQYGLIVLFQQPKIEHLQEFEASETRKIHVDTRFNVEGSFGYFD